MTITRAPTAVRMPRAIAPGPRGCFPLGCLGAFRRDPLEFLLRAARTHGDVVRFRLGPVLAHLVNHPDHVAQVLQHNWRNYDKQTRSVAKIRSTCGDSLLSSDGESWLRQRRLIQPAFQPQALTRHAPVIAAETDVLLQRWVAAARAGRAIDVVSEMARVTLIIAAQVLLGADVRAETDTVERSLGVILDDTWRRIESIIDPAVVSPAFHRREYRESVAALDEIVNRMVDVRRKNADGDDLLSALVRAQDAADGRLTDRELRDATLTLLLAGHETTANALAWTLWLTSQTAGVDAELRHEARQVLGNRRPEPDDLDRLPYAGAVFAEAIRLYPSIWIIERRVVAEDEIAGYCIPAGSTVLISPYVLHRTAAHWPEPDVFDPQRFVGVEHRNRLTEAYIPFGLGPHHCIGRHLAQIVAQVVLSMIAARFRLRCVGDCSPTALPGITLRHAESLWMIPETVE